MVKFRVQDLSQNVGIVPWVKTHQHTGFHENMHIVFGVPGSKNVSDPDSRPKVKHSSLVHTHSAQ